MGMGGQVKRPCSRGVATTQLHTTVGISENGFLVFLSSWSAFLFRMSDWFWEDAGCKSDAIRDVPPAGSFAFCRDRSWSNNHPKKSWSTTFSSLDLRSRMPVSFPRRLRIEIDSRFEYCSFLLVAANNRHHHQCCWVVLLGRNGAMARRTNLTKLRTTILIARRGHAGSL